MSCYEWKYKGGPAPPVGMIRDPGNSRPRSAVALDARSLPTDLSSFSLTSDL